MRLTSQTQQTVLAIASYFVKLPSITGYEYGKTLSLKAYSDTLKKYISVYVCHYAEVKFFNPPML